MILRDYQERGLAELHHYIDEAPLLAAPCGAGKTEIATRLVEILAVPTLFLAHRRELVDQAAARLRASGLRVGVVAPGVEPDPGAPVQVASIPTLARRRTLPLAPRLVIWDECAHAQADSWARLRARLPSAWHVGLTATPYRLDGRPLAAMFGRLVVAAQPSDLVRRGVLARPRVFGAAVPPARFHVRAGDFAAEEVEAAVNRPGLVADIVRTWQRLADGRRTVAFAASIAHSKALVERFKAAGVAAAHLDGEIPAEERAAILASWRAGTVRVVANCALVAEGFDLPEIGVAILARPTASLALHVQQCGRALRSAEGKADALILDHAGNVARLGWPTQDIPATLDGGVTDRAERKARLPAVRRCPACLAIAEGSPDVCPECGKPYPVKRVVLAEREGELREAREATPFSIRAGAWETIKSDQIYLRREDGWAAHIYHERFGSWPVLDEHGRLIEPRPQDGRLAAAWHALQDQAREAGYKPGWAFFRFRARYGVDPPRAVRA